MTQRRGHNEGTIFERTNKDGKVVSYRAQVSLPDGSRKSISGKTRMEVRQQLDRIKGDLASGRLVVRRSPTVAEYLRDWLEQLATSVRPATLQSYQAAVVRVTPHIGHLRLDQLRPADLQACYARLLESGLAASTVAQTHTILRGALRHAVKLEALGRDVSLAVRPPRVERREQQILSPEQVRTLLQATADDRLGALWALLVTTGLRIGEALGLTWQAIDFEAGSISVRYILVPQTGKGLVLTEPKTRSSRRTIHPDAATMAALRRQRTRQMEERLAAGSGWQNPDNLVFTTGTGHGWSRSHVHTLWHKALTACGQPSLRLHDLRHTAASYLLSLGVPPNEVQVVLGHSSFSVTMNIYAHLMPSQAKRTLGAMGALFAEDAV